MNKGRKKAFNYEDGQFICHIYKAIPPDDKLALYDVIETIQKEQEKLNTGSYRPVWVPVCDGLGSDDDDISLHITLLRGHRAIYYHQIRSLVSALKSECEQVEPFTICLDKLTMYDNLEKTKQFLCISSRRVPDESSGFYKLKRILKNTVDLFATKLTDEDETKDTSAHFSLMVREITNDLKHQDLDADLEKIEQLCIRNLGDYPTYLIRINTIQIKIGNHVYDLSLKG